ncbi:hypothetical protein PGLA_19575 [Paenibacillus glacialis]|uniref:Knr4/Smi1-like domain-containing protein n=2 Tax=Paenibacillus glacialis TaxID=494026 RepID=A0A168I4J7_9BACL|nr:hypothetical protein PGLA_19575 [Paenibacillus glacialis]
MGVSRWLFVDGPVEENIMNTVEKSFGVSFLSDYKECVIKFNGGYPEPNKFDFDNGIQGVFNDLISFTNEDLNIQMFYNFNLDTFTRGIVPFARDPFGNLLCFDYRESKKEPQIIFYNHEESDFVLICNSFTELLGRMYSIEDEEG